MKYITDAKEAKQIDNISINEIGIPSLVLMERAALSVVDEIQKKIIGKLKSISKRNDEIKVLVVAGMGNNGADGCGSGKVALA